MKTVLKIKVLEELLLLKRDLVDFAVTIEITTDQKKQIYAAILKIDLALIKLQQLRSNTGDNNQFHELTGRINEAVNTVRNAGDFQEISEYITRASEALDQVIAHVDSDAA